MPAFAIDRETEDALIPLSALQHYLFCPRQCALIHVEQLWAEDAATAEGCFLHEKADSGRPETRPGVRIARGQALRSTALGVSGIADVVEFHGGRKGEPAVPFPVEYKRGKPKAHRADEVQLCAQAICLKEALAFRYLSARCSIAKLDGALPSPLTMICACSRHKPRRRREPWLRHRSPPPPVRMPACRHCSLEGLCQPARLEKPPRIEQWLARQLEK